MRKQREEKGITLIALIITIIVLLILAGVSIAMLTGENGILKRAEGTEVTQAQAELTEEMQLAIMESLIDRDNAHTIDNVLQIAEANSYISINNQHTLMNAMPESSEIGASTYSLGNTNVYVTDDCTAVTVVDVDLGVWVILGQEGTNVTIESGNGNDTINVADLRILKLEFEVGDAYTEDGKENLVDIKVKAILDPNSSKSSSYIKEISDENGNELTLKDLEGGQNGDQNSYAIYTVESNGEYKFTALEEHGGKATRSAIVSNSNYAEIEFEKNPDLEEGKKAEEVVVTINYDMYVDQSTLEYSTNGTNWEEAKNGQEVVVNENGTTVYARYSGISDSIKTITIDCIDDGPPTVPEIQVSETSCTSLKVKITKESEDDSGIEKYEVIVLNDGVQVSRKEIIEAPLEVEFTELKAMETYSVIVKAYDNSDKSSETEPQEIVLNHVVASEYINDLFKEETKVYCECGEYILTVPEGFMIPDDNGIDLVMKRNSIVEGIVIQDESLNEFVWVPGSGEAYDRLVAVTEAKILSNTTGTYNAENQYVSTKIYNNNALYEPFYLTYSESDLAYKMTETTLIEKFNEMRDTVVDRGGFYIGRYEMSIGAYGRATSIKGSEPITGTTVSTSKQTSNSYWYGLYDVAKTYINEDVGSVMMSNAQYDIMIEWFTEEEINESGRLTSAGMSGDEETDKIRNIYDLTGGIEEWTTGGFANGYRVKRGGESSGLASDVIGRKSS